jgi:hypothetical protein
VPGGTIATAGRPPGKPDGSQSRSRSRVQAPLLEARLAAGDPRRLPRRPAGRAG